MGLLIADAGATKTIWFMPKKGEQTIVTRGIQPVLQVDSEIEAIVYDELFLHQGIREYDHIIFYGAGCGAWNNAERLRRILKTAFPKAKIEIKTDIEGAGRAVFQKGDGIILISGTGSSAGFMRNGDLIDQMNQPVWPQGDLGSGAHIGSLILNDYFGGKAPESLQRVINENRRLSEDDLFVQFQHADRSKQIAAKALKDVALAMDENSDMKNYVIDKVVQAYQEWTKELESHFRSALKQTPVALSGSAAYGFRETIIPFFKERGISVHNIVKDPVEGLSTYHLSQC